MNSGVGSSGSPTQNARMSLRPRPSLYNSRILEEASAWTAAHAPSGVSNFMRRTILDCGQMSHARWSLIAALVTMVLWGVNFAFVKYLLDTLGVGPFLFIRFVSMPLLAFLLLFLVFRRNIARTWPKREDLPRFIACGLIGHALHVGVVFWGISLSTAFSSALVLTSGPLFTLAILVLLGAERLRASQVAGTLVAMAGIALFLSDKFARGVAHAGLGDLVLLVAAAFFSRYPVFLGSVGAVF